MRRCPLELAAAPRIREQVVDRRAHGGVGERGLPLDHPRQRPHLPDIGERDQQRRLRLHAAKEPHHLALLVRCRDRARSLGENVVETALGLAFEQAGEPLGLGPRQLPEIG
jgi:hypothetical protein